MKLDAVSLSRQELEFERPQRSESRFQGAIFSPQGLSGKFLKQASIESNRSFLDRKVERAFLNSSPGSHIMVTTRHDRSGGGTSAQFEVRWDWGGREEPRTSFTASAEAHDRSGNRVEVEISKSSTGESSSAVRGGVEKETDNR